MTQCHYLVRSKRLVQKAIKIHNRTMPEYVLKPLDCSMYSVAKLITKVSDKMHASSYALTINLLNSHLEAVPIRNLVLTEVVKLDASFHSALHC